MEEIQDWAAYLLGDHGTLYTYSPYIRQFYSVLSTAQSYILPLIDQVTRKPDLATIALLLVILFVSLKLLDMLWQTLLFWMRLARKVLFWGGLAALGMWMYARGPDGVMEDVQYWFQVWNSERDYWREREKVARMARQKGASGSAGWF